MIHDIHFFSFKIQNENEILNLLWHLSCTCFWYHFLQEAFFGKGILDQTKETTKDLLKQESESDGEQGSPAKPLPVSGKQKKKSI